MKVKDSPKFNAEFPEMFEAWALIDSPKLEKVASALVQEARFQGLQSPEHRTALPGIRFALNEIAKVADILFVSRFTEPLRTI
jgi:hypothetical protein